MSDAANATFSDNSRTPVFVDQEIQRLNREITLITAALTAKKVWYRDVSTIVSLAAVLISALTFVVGRSQDTEAKKTELHATLRQISATFLQVEESKIKFPDKSSVIEHISFDQSTILAKRAYSLVRALGSAATATDLIGVSNALRFVNEESLAQSLLEIAEQRVNEVVEYTSVYRSLGVLSVLRREFEQGGRYFNKALDVFTVYPASNPGVVLTMTFGTRLEWARALHFAGECEAASGHLNEAGKLLLGVNNPNSVQMAADYNGLREMIVNCTQVKATPAAMVK